jgi:hypothetical protein
LRFLRFLLSTENGKANCLLANNQNEDVILPAICAENEGEMRDGPFFDLFVYFRYRPFLDEIDRKQFNRLLEITAKIALFCPTFFLDNQKFNGI